MKDGMPGEREFEKQIFLSPSVRLRARIEVTNKGNGILEIGDLKLHVVDEHDDGIYFEGGLLSIDFVDIDHDGKREMVLSGIACFTGEKGDMVRRREALVFIYKLRDKRHFDLVYRNTDFSIELE
jgi:hypothetical protein